MSCDCTETTWCEDCYNREASSARDELRKMFPEKFKSGEK